MRGLDLEIVEVLQHREDTVLYSVRPQQKETVK